MTYNLIQLKAWAEQSGIKFWTTPQAKNTVEGYGGRSKCKRCNTCEICPTGARYSPDWTFKQLLEREEDRSCTTRRSCGSSCSTTQTPRIAAAQAVQRGRHRTTAVEYRAKPFVARLRLLLEPASAAGFRRTHGSRTGSRTPPITSAGT